MKVKRFREDFVVNEIADFPLGGGNHATYRLHKSGIGTPEAVREILNIWNLPSHQVSYGGLKDRHAITSQHLTIYQGPQADIDEPGFTLQYLGQARRAFTAQDILANEFDIKLRGLPLTAAERLLRVLNSSSVAVPNYFDEQRFGSVGESGRFVAHPWCLGDYEQALFLAIAEANPHDRPRDREQKEILRALWGNWQACKDQLERSHRRSIVTYLVDHPSGFKKAVALIRKDLRGLFVAAFQGKLWNEIVSRKIAQLIPAHELCQLESVAGRWSFPKQLSSDWASALQGVHVPLPSGRQTQWQPDIQQLLEQILAEFGMQRHQLRFSYPRDVFFSRGQRDVLLAPQQFACQATSDETGALPSMQLELQFRLQPGQYATMLLKGLQALAEPTSEELA